MASRTVRLLIVDFLDSYTHNIPSFIKDASIDPHSVSISIATYKQLRQEKVSILAQRYHAFVLSAGPGTVDCPDDLGHFVPALLAFRPAVPVFGICLGFQAICKACGGSIRRLSMPHHGLVSDIVEPISHRSLGRQGTRYHSLEVCPDHLALKGIEVLAVAENFDAPGSFSLMEIKHTTLPFWGTQYHPESICSVACHKVIVPFLQAASARARFEQSQALDNTATFEDHSFAHVDCAEAHNASEVIWERIENGLDLLDVTAFGSGQDFAFLHSMDNAEWSLYTSASTAKPFRYSLRTSRASFGNESHILPAEDVWKWLKAISGRRRFVGGPPEVPFWGGFVGYFSYEMGLAELSLNPYPYRNKIAAFDDIYLLWSSETILRHHPTNSYYLVSLDNNKSWLDNTRDFLEILSRARCRPTDSPPLPISYASHPDKLDYQNKVRDAQEQIKSGNSYEICLTAPSTHRTYNSQLGTKLSIKLFKSLCRKNPARFMSFLSLNKPAESRQRLEFLSASPESFLSFFPGSKSTCGIAQMKPIKGTIGKSQLPQPPILAEAEQYLKTPKVIAENLMIVDLIRNDLARLSDKVTTPQLMVIEEVETLYQLVSTVSAETKEGVTAWDLLRCTLPPGSMTGAPKLRSCQILQTLEADLGQNFRGLYSGVVGYVDVRGCCQTSVSIRNATKYPGEDFWRVGAGGAITCLSDPDEEWDERRVKEDSVGRIFQDAGFEVLETILWDPETGLRFWDEHVRRLVKTLRVFGFKGPSAENTSSSRDDEAAEGSDASNSDPTLALDSYMGAVREASSHLKHFINAALPSSSRTQPHRLSLTISAAGKPSLKALALPPSPSQQPLEPLKVFLDPVATPIAADLEPFIANKTTFRAPYENARRRVDAAGRDEVLLFSQPGPSRAADGTEEASDRGDEGDHVLTEGSYTNVAVFSIASERWITPSTNCLPGIERQRLLDSGEVVLGTIRRRSLRRGVRVRLFNSVRGVFEGDVV